MAYTKFNKDIFDYVIFDTNHSYTFFGLVLMSVKVETAKRKTVKVSNIYTQGDEDITDSVISQARYNNRKITLEFKCLEGIDQFNAILQRTMNYLHEKYMSNIYISKYNSYYEGRIRINEFLTDRFIGKITIEIDAKPWHDVFKAEFETTYTFGSAQTVNVPITLTKAIGDVIRVKPMNLAVYVSGTWLNGGDETSVPSSTWKEVGLVDTTSGATQITLRTTYSSSSVLTQTRTLYLESRARYLGW